MKAKEAMLIFEYIAKLIASDSQERKEVGAELMELTSDIPLEDDRQKLTGPRIAGPVE